ncbi:hypothetical protein [Aureimonas sp. AU4]|uniref:hypothetical protein n=1 Tax=Aureimonas sp. AU4 TaxID=1638163 RepID=UPI000782C527|nr:hypothetical protein [Aureimonas sp. AU4]
MTTFDSFGRTRAARPPTQAKPGTAGWRGRLRLWWDRLGWDPHALPETLRADVERDHPHARPVRGRADWERRL